MNIFRKKLPGHAAALRDIRACQDDLKLKARTQLATLSKSIAMAPDTLPEQIADVFAYTNTASAAIQSLQQCHVEPKSTRPNQPRHFYLSSVFARDAFDYLTAEKRERLIYVTGTETDDGTVVFSTLRQIAMSSQSPAYVAADAGQSATYLDHLTTNAKHSLWGMWHSHIMHGKASTRPSQTDLAHQHRLVKFGMPDTLGGIYSLDGWIRIFSTATDFKLSVYGGGLELVDDNPREKILKLNVNIKETANVSSLAAE